MPRYCSLEDIAKAIPARTLIELSNDDPEAVTPDNGIIEWHIEQSEQVVDGFIRERYPVPFVEVPTLVRTWTIAIARHALYCRRIDGQELPDAVVRTYKDALKMLEMVQARKVSLGVESGDQANQEQPQRSTSRARAPARMFGDDTLGKFYG